MDKHRLQAILDAVAEGELTPAEALESLKTLPYEDIGFATIDSHRAIRQVLPEVIFCPGKTPEQVVKIAQALKSNHDLVLAARAGSDLADQVLPLLPGAQYDPAAKMIYWGESPAVLPGTPCVSIVTAGTADLPVAAEAAFILGAAGIAYRQINDVGVAGIHRLFQHLPHLYDSATIIVAAGMDGALASVIAGLVTAPVIAVPTSIGYGASLQGLAALLSMLNSCAPGLTVVNVDNGFGAAMAAIRIVSVLQSCPVTGDAAHRPHQIS